MGDVLGNVDNSMELDTMKKAAAVDANPGKVQTDVIGVFADGMKDNLPVFDVEDDDFYKNMKSDRKRMRFSSDNPVSQYLKQTRYNRSFFIKTKDGKYMRRIK
jgi:hypothetical protein